MLFYFDKAPKIVGSIGELKDMIKEEMSNFLQKDHAASLTLSKVRYFW